MAYMYAYVYIYTHTHYTHSNFCFLHIELYLIAPAGESRHFIFSLDSSCCIQVQTVMSYRKFSKVLGSSLFIRSKIILGKKVCFAHGMHCSLKDFKSTKFPFAFWKQWKSQGKEKKCTFQWQKSVKVSEAVEDMLMLFRYSQIECKHCPKSVYLGHEYTAYCYEIASL